MMNIVTRRLNQPTASFLLAGSTRKVKNQLEKLFLIQSKNICHKDDLDPQQVALRLPPFPYKEKNYTWAHRYFKLEGFNPTWGRFTENTKVVVVEGNIGSGKEEVAKKLAEEMGMKYFPDVNAEMDYRFDDGWDFRDLNIHFPEDVHFPDFRSVLETRNPYQAGAWEMYMLRLRTYNYLQAIVHMLHTGDGVVIERSPWTGTVFARTANNLNMLSQNYLDHYWEIRSKVLCQTHRPHVVIYLDVPVDKCLENAKKKNTHGCADLLDEDYLKLVEKNYKQYFLPIIDTHAEMFTYHLNQPVTAENAAEISEMIVDELSESDMDEYFMRITSNEDKFNDWKLYDSDERWTTLRFQLTRDKTDILSPFEIYPYYVDELWRTYSLLSARAIVMFRELDLREKRIEGGKSLLEKMFYKKPKYEERDAENWFIKTGYAPCHVTSVT